jgi:hypothetical protein
LEQLFYASRGDVVGLQHLLMADVWAAAAPESIHASAITEPKKQALALPDSKSRSARNFIYMIRIESLLLRDLSQQARPDEIGIRDTHEMI